MYKVPVYDLRIAEEGYSHVTMDIVGHHESPRENIRNHFAGVDVAHSYLKGKDREHLIVILLSSNNKIIGINTCHIGSINASVVHPREVFKPAILGNAAAIVVSHNHPSGDPTPSMADIQVTERLREVGQIIGIELVDHIIVGNKGCYSSMKTKGVI